MEVVQRGRNVYMRRARENGDTTQLKACVPDSPGRRSLHVTSVPPYATKLDEGDIPSGYLGETEAWHDLRGSEDASGIVYRVEELNQ